MNPVVLARRPLFSRRAAVDVAIAAGAALIQLGGTALAAGSQHGVRALDWFGYLLLAAAAAVLVARRRWPVPAGRLRRVPLAGDAGQSRGDSVGGHGRGHRGVDALPASGHRTGP